MTASGADTGAETGVEPEHHLAELDGVPLTLLPVRLETRYIGPPSDPAELRIRVYPDQVHVDAHRPELTAGEIATGQQYWRTRWDPTTAERAWAELIRGVRPARALWIVRTLTPSNPIGDPDGPRFPTVVSVDAAIDHPLTIRAMPTRWVALGYDAKGRQVLRRWFDQPVSVGLLASAELTDGPPVTGDEAVDSYLGWASDYDAAVTAGMAVTIAPSDLTGGHTLVDGLDRLVVVGVDWTGDGAGQLEELLGAHEVTDGLGFLAPGTPTNNLDEAPAGGGAAPVADPSLPPSDLDPRWTAGARVAAALGLDPGLLARLPGAATQTARIGADLVDATWSASLGYFADQLLTPLVSDANLADTRDHAVQFLQPLGPVPTLRVGRQPLGLLPVVAPNSTLADAYAAELGGVLARLRPMWEASVARVPRLVDETSEAGHDLEATLLAVLRRSPWTDRVWYRRVFGPLVGFGADAIGQVLQFQAGVRSMVFLDALDVTVQPRIAPFGIHDRTRHLAIPMLGTSADGAPPSLAYLSKIHSLTAEAGGRSELSHSVPNSVLAALATFAALQEIDLAGARMTRRLQPTRGAVAWRTTEISGIGTLTEPSPLARATATVSEFDGRTVAEEVAHRQLVDPGHAHLGDLGAFQAALDRLAVADPADVEPALRAYLGCCSHRLDAWLTSLASRQLAAVRTAKPTGTHVGGFGYVERLRPETAPDSQGYLLAPSLAHAATAGVLRSGYLAQLSTGTESLDVDLSSARVQLALEIMRGVREETPLSVLLGYRFERALRESDLSAFILPTRTVFPLRETPPPDDPTQPVETTPPSNVVDAATLLERWSADPTGVLGAVRAAADVPAADPRLSRVAARIDALADIYDAIADVVLAEAIHQIIKGQPERAQAATRFLDRQEPPVEPEVTMSPRSSTGYVQRCVLALAAEQPSPAWLPLSDARSAAEPRLNAWLASILGEPTSWAFAGQTVDADGSVLGREVVALADLGLSPLSLVVAAGSGSGARPSELEERIAAQLASVLDPAAEDVVELLAETSGALGLAPFVALASCIRRLLHAAKPGDARSLDRPDSAAVPGLDATDLGHRADAAEAGLLTAADELDQAIATAAPVSELAAVLDRVSRAGVSGATAPLGFSASTADDALDFARDVQTAARSRVAQLTALAANVPGADASDAVVAAHHQRRMAITFGDAFPALGTFEIPAGSDAAASLQPASQTTLLRSDPLAPVTWMTRMARVRPDLDALWQVLTSAEAVVDYDATGFVVAQLPHQPGAAWAALPFDEGSRPTAEVAVAMHAPFGTNGRLAALVVDSWTEQIPSPAETAGLSFHYDAPSNRAPQSAIVAVPPALTDHPWTLDLIAETVLEAFELTRIRGVTLADLPAAGSILPALYLPFDPGGNVPSVNLDLLADRFGPATLVLGRD